jgi:hypothetical protein
LSAAPRFTLITMPWTLLGSSSLLSSKGVGIGGESDIRKGDTRLEQWIAIESLPVLLLNLFHCI